jgi:hypothetical protein
LNEFNVTHKSITCDNSSIDTTFIAGFESFIAKNHPAAGFSQQLNQSSRKGQNNVKMKIFGIKITKYYNGLSPLVSVALLLDPMKKKPFLVERLDGVMIG